jgi:hypothetical protein
MPLAATDWNEVTAIATIALGGVTAVLAIAAIVAAWYARRGLQAASADLKATQEATKVTREMSQQQIEASRRPLLIDVPPDWSSDLRVGRLARRKRRMRLSFGDGHSHEIDPGQIYVHREGSRLYIAVPLRNVGTGLAVIPRAISILALANASIAETTYGVAERARVPPGETTRISCVAGIHAEPTYPWLVTISVVYYDYLNGQEAATVVYLEQARPRAEWTLRDIEHELPERPPDRPSLVFVPPV